MNPSYHRMKGDVERKKILMDVATQIVEDNVDLSTSFYSDTEDMTTDGVQAYACEILSLGLLYFEFRDAIKEGDGDRVIRVSVALVQGFQENKLLN